jgi:hypothetical protein
MTIELTEDEALVLFELLQGYGVSNNGRNLAVERAAERNALWALEAALERTLVTPFRADYAEKLDDARQRLELQGGSW